MNFNITAHCKEREIIAYSNQRAYRVADMTHSEAVAAYPHLSIQTCKQSEIMAAAEAGESWPVMLGLVTQDHEVLER